MNLSKTVAFLAWVLGFVWIFISFGRFLQERLVIDTNLLFWVLWASFVLNVGLVAYLFDIRRNGVHSNQSSVPQQP